jgi:hypothetical protein
MTGQESSIRVLLVDDETEFLESMCKSPRKNNFGGCVASVR